MYVFTKKRELEEILLRKNLSQGDFAKGLEITETYLSMIKDPEKYSLSPGPDLRDKMLRYLDVKFDDIFFIQNYRFNGNNQKNSTDAT